MNYRRRSGYQRHEVDLKHHEVDLGLGHGSTIGNVSGPEVHLREIMENAAAYLRVAHIYMLISMPTETSTIFGAFQAIWLSLDTGRIPSLQDKVLRIRKFAS